MVNLRLFAYKTIVIPNSPAEQKKGIHEANTEVRVDHQQVNMDLATVLEFRKENSREEGGNGQKQNKNPVLEDWSRRQGTKRGTQAQKIINENGLPEWQDGDKVNKSQEHLSKGS